MKTHNIKGGAGSWGDFSKPHHTQGKKEESNVICIKDVKELMCGCPKCKLNDTREDMKHAQERVDMGVREIEDNLRQMNHPILVTEPSKGWEKEFDEYFKGYILQEPDEIYISFDVIKSFIRSVESRAREEERERVVKVLEGMKPPSDYPNIFKGGYNRCASSAIEAINK